MFNSYKIINRPPEYKFVEPGVIVCIYCDGTGKSEDIYYGKIAPLVKCNYCDGAGTLKLKKPTKEMK